MGNSEHLAILKQGVASWNKWRQENPEIIPNLSSTNLRRENLREADLRGASDFGAKYLYSFSKTLNSKAF